MAFIPKDPNLEDEQNQAGQPGAPAPIGGESAALGQGQTGGSAGGASGKATPANRTASSSGFTNLNKYLEANRSQAAGLGSQVRSDIGQSIDQAKTAASTADQGYREKLNPSQYQFNAKTFDPVNADRAKFQNIFAQNNAQFGSGGELDAANKAIADARTKANQIETIGGRKELIGGMQGLTKDKGLNTAGLRSFDNLLLQSSDEGKKAIESTRADLDAANLDEKLAQSTARAQAEDKAIRELQAKAQSEARAALASQAGGLNQSLASRLAQEKQNVMNSERSLLSLAGSGADLSAADLKTLGVTPAQWRQVQDLARTSSGASGVFGDRGGINRYVNRTDAAANLRIGDVATADDLARANALRELAAISGSQVQGLDKLPTSAKAASRDYMDLDIQRLIRDLASAGSGIKNPDYSPSGTFDQDLPQVSNYEVDKSSEELAKALRQNPNLRSPTAFNTANWF